MSFFVTSSKGRKEIPVADCWIPDLKAYPPKLTPCTTEQFSKICTDWNGEDLVKLFSIIASMDYKVLHDTHDYVLEEQLLNATRFVYEEPMAFKEAKVPESITINSLTVKVQLKIGSLSIGQSIHVRQALEKAKAWEELIAFVVAVYIQPIYDESDFDYHRAMELEQDIKKLPITETYPLAFFLLRPILKTGTSTLSRLNLLILRLLVFSTRRELA